MDYGTYMPDGSYSGWKTYNSEKRYFAFSQNKKYAYMKVGLSFINGVTMYFDQDGYMVNSGIEDETVIKKIGSYYYAVDYYGEVTIDDWEDIDDFSYYFDDNGRMLRNGKYEINGEYYLFDTLVTGKCGKIDGDKYYFDKTGCVQKNKIIKIGKKQYYFNGSGKMVHNRTFKLYGKKYHSDKNGVVKIVKKKAKK